MTEGNLLPLIVLVFVLFAIYIIAKGRHEKRKRDMKERRRFGRR